MAIRAFPPVDLADEYGLLAVGGDLDPSSLMLAYQNGIFPWPLPGEERITWFAPPRRAVLFVDEFRASRSLLKSLARKQFTFRFDEDFGGVMDGCASLINRRGQESTWLGTEMRAAYAALHRLGHAHSIECYEGENLVGGLYGVGIGSVFTGESMFFRVPDASKASLWVLNEYLRSIGIEWLDCQVQNPHLATLGVRELSRAHFMRLLGDGILREPIEFSNDRLTSLVAQLCPQKTTKP